MTVVLIGGPRGIGKSSIIDLLIDEHGSYERPKAYTTRLPRPKENPTQFIHVSQAALDLLHSDGKLLTLDEVHGARYALAKGSIESIEEQGKIAIKEFYIRDHPSIKAIYPNSVSVVIMPTSEQAYMEHIQRRFGANSLDNRLNKCELSIHQEAIDQNTTDTIIYNDFIKPIREIAKIINHTIKNKY
ncbi:MAG: hypothetical protein JKX76_03235 [Colwellia sp.]|nr:hypothetical protein [Colwellia sp.]